MHRTRAPLHPGLALALLAGLAACALDRPPLPTREAPAPDADAPEDAALDAPPAPQDAAADAAPEDAAADAPADIAADLPEDAEGDAAEADAEADAEDAALVDADDTGVPPCVPGEVDNGLGVCAREGACAPGFHEDGYGRCIDAPACRPGLEWTGERCQGSLEAAPLPAPRSKMTATLLRDGRVLVVGGDDRSATTTAGDTAAFLYDPAADAWSMAAPTATPHAHHTARRLADGRVLITGGGGDTEVYDPADNTWAPGPLLEGDAVRTLLEVPGLGWVFFGSQAPPTLWSPDEEASLRRLDDAAAHYRRLFAAASTEGEVLLSGFREDGDARFMEVWTEARGFEELPTRAGTVFDGEAAAVGGALWVVGGRNLAGTGASLCSLLTRRDADDDWRWVNCGELQQRRVHHRVLVEPPGRVLALGGTAQVEEGAALDSVEIYDTAEPRWVVAPELLRARRHPAVVSLGEHRALVIGGGSRSNAAGGSAIADVEIYVW